MTCILSQGYRRGHATICKDAVGNDQLELVTCKDDERGLDRRGKVALSDDNGDCVRAKSTVDTQGRIERLKVERVDTTGCVFAVDYDVMGLNASVLERYERVFNLVCTLA